MSAATIGGQTYPQTDAPQIRLVTERDAVLRERAAFRRGALFAREDKTFYTEKFIEQEGGFAYPLPTVTRPRVVLDPCEPQYEWSVRDGALHFRWLKTDPSNWKRASGMWENMLLTPLPDRVAMWADLYANPTEEVES